MSFNITSQKLQVLMELRGKEAVNVINNEYGGIKGFLNILKVRLNEGINKDETAIRSEVFGINEIPSRPPKSIFILMWEALQDVTLVILIIAALISLILSLYVKYFSKNSEEDSGWIESVAIMVAVIVVVIVVSFNDWQKERQFRGLQQKVEAESRVNVVRSSEMVSINTKDLVVGDICLVKYGDVLPADGIVLQCNDLKIDESSLTGESDLVIKTIENDPILLSGSRVMEGSGKMVVSAVGPFSQAGIIYALLQTNADIETNKAVTNSTDPNPSDAIGPKENLTEVAKPQPRDSIAGQSTKEKSILQNKLTILAIQIGYAGTFVALITVLILTLSYVVTEFIQKKTKWETTRDIAKFINFFIIGVTVLVVAVPEGLPLAVTISLAYSVKKMMKDNNLVRHLDACETMGNATSICSDKTGTLTTNRMTAVKYYIYDEIYENMNDLYPTLNELMKKLLTTGIIINCSYSSIIKYDDKLGGLPFQMGNKTECALLGFVESLGGDIDKIRHLFSEDKLYKVYTFNSSRKCMSTVIKVDNEYHLYTKGASEIIISKCNSIVGKGGKLRELSQAQKRELINQVIEPMATEGLRTIGCAYKVLYDSTEQPLNWDDEENIHSELTCFAIFGIEDPVRPEVPDAIISCQNAGITVRMVTGDNLETARSIAYKCGIIQSLDQNNTTRSEIMDSKQFNERIRDPDTKQFSQTLFDSVYPNLRVLARSSPQDKYVLVSGIINSHLGDSRQIVAVTGDGTNDGPALKKADVGFAMGITGTDVAKEASDIILTDDNFNSIVKAVMWGRNVYDSITKFLQFQLTVNVVAIIVAFMGACFISDSPLRAIQMLWVNLIMDTLASLALATEMPSDELLQRAPYGRTASLINKTMIKNIVGHSIYQLIVIIYLLFFGHLLLNTENGQTLLSNHETGPNVHFTVIFNTFVLMTLFNEFNARKIHGQRNVFSGLHRNPLFIIIWILTMIGQVIIVQFGGAATFTSALDFHQWLWCFVFGLGDLLWGQIIITVPDSVIPNISMSDNNSPYKDHKEKRNTSKYTPIDSAALLEYLSNTESSHDTPQIGGQILWLKGLTRLQSQLQVVEAFRSNIQNINHDNHNLNSFLLKRRQRPLGVVSKASVSNHIDITTAHHDKGDEKHLEKTLLIDA